MTSEAVTARRLLDGSEAAAIAAKFSRPSPILVPGTCSVCGCTNDHACEGGCSWANQEKTICSMCVRHKPLVLKGMIAAEASGWTDEYFVSGTGPAVLASLSGPTIPKGRLAKIFWCKEYVAAFAAVSHSHPAKYVGMMQLIPFDRWQRLGMGDVIDPRNNGKKSLSDDAICKGLWEGVRVVSPWLTLLEETGPARERVYCDWVISGHSIEVLVPEKTRAVIEAADEAFLKVMK